MTEDTVPFESQVGGHPGLRITTDGSRIIKSTLASERHFYETVVNGHAEGFKLLSKHVPTFYGVASAAAEGEVLENVSHAFTKPNILDIKLGTVLYDDLASEDKKQRAIKAAQNTTSLETGIRITGFQVYDTTTDKSIHTEKPYGRALSAARLPEAMARFFPIRTPILALSTPTPNSEGGNTDLTPSPAGTRPELLLPVLRGVLGAIKEIKQALAKTDMRMIAGSVLIIYEGDELALEKALEARERRVQETAPETGGNAKAVATNEIPPAYTAKLIDFAHTKLQDGLGPDEGAILGLTTTISLLEGRIKEVQEVLGSRESVV